MGALYVYKLIQRGNDIKAELFFTLHATDKKSGARFGAAMANAGDIDGDGKEDFAVAAPYEGDGGAVYIFRGHEGTMLEGIIFVVNSNKVLI